MVRAREAGGRDPRSGLTAEDWKRHLAQLFEATARAKPGYVKIRFIGLNDGGKEIIRIDRLREQRAGHTYAPGLMTGRRGLGGHAPPPGTRLRLVDQALSAPARPWL